MRHLLDTGILLRLLDREAEAHATVRQAVRALKERDQECVCTLQNLCEFWNVCTRPESARGSMGLPFDQAWRRLRAVGRIAGILPDLPAVVDRWRQLVQIHEVRGVQVYDTRLVAAMDVHRLTHLVTLNPGDFRRFSHLTVLTPDDLLTA
jgi:predicted nucleic acid-binding protein